MKKLQIKNKDQINRNRNEKITIIKERLEESLKEVLASI